VSKPAILHLGGAAAGVASLNPWLPAVLHIASSLFTTFPSLVWLKANLAPMFFQCGRIRVQTRLLYWYVDQVWEIAVLDLAACHHHTKPHETETRQSV